MLSDDNNGIICHTRMSGISKKNNRTFDNYFLNVNFLVTKHIQLSHVVSLFFIPIEREPFPRILI